MNENFENPKKMAIPEISDGGTMTSGLSNDGTMVSLLSNDGMMVSHDSQDSRGAGQ